MQGDAFDNRAGDWRPTGSDFRTSGANSGVTSGKVSPGAGTSPGKDQAGTRTPATPGPSGLAVSSSGGPGALPNEKLSSDLSDVFDTTPLLMQAAELASKFDGRRRSPDSPSGSMSPMPNSSSGADADTVALYLSEEGVLSTGSVHDEETGGEDPVGVTTEAPADNLDAPVWRLEPEAAHPTVRLQRNFAWCPWTKTYIALEAPLRIKRLWCWQRGNLSWWTAFLFLLGSAGFFSGAMVATLQVSAEKVYLKVWGELIPYLLGGLCFVAGAFTLSLSTAELVDWDTHRDYATSLTQPLLAHLGGAPRSEPDHEAASCAGSHYTQPAEPQSKSFLGVWEVLPAPGEGPIDQPTTLPRRESSGVRLFRRAAAEQEFQRLWLEFDPWTRRQHMVEMIGAVQIFIGTLFYKVGLFTDLIITLQGGSNLSPEMSYLLMVTTLQCGSVLFVSGGYLLCAAYERAWLPWRLLIQNPRTATVAWWVVMINMTGSLLFLLGAMPLDVPAPHGIARTFVQNFFGWGVGAFLFFIQSWLMIIEVASAEDDEAPEEDTLAIRGATAGPLT